MDATTLGTTPIPGEHAAGMDAKYEPEYTEVSEEISKLGSATQGGAVAWTKIAQQGEILLAQKTKDLQIAAYVGIAWQKTEGLAGFHKAVQLYLGLLGTFWETAFPPVNKLRRRTNAFDWWHERALAELEKDGEQTAQPEEMLKQLSEELSSLDQLASELMPDAVPLRELMETVRRLPAEQENTQQQEETTKVQEAEPAPPAPQAQAPTQAPAPALSEQPSADDLPTALKAFSESGVRYALLAHRENPEDPLAWQIMRLALWSKVTHLPPADNGQTPIPPPDADRLAGLKKTLATGKYLEAALAAEDLFATAIFCLDLQCIVDKALGELGESYAAARRLVQKETAAFLKRLPGLEQLSFDGGVAFASDETQAWLSSLGTCEESQAKNGEPSQSPQRVSYDALAELVAEAERLYANKELGASLQLLEKAQGSSPAQNMALRVRELRLLCRSGECNIAAALAQGLLKELQERQIDRWDTSLALDVLIAAREAFTLAKNTDQANAVQETIACLCPSAALGWKH